MSVLLECLSVIVKNSKIISDFPGEMNGFMESMPSGHNCTDGEIIRVGFMHPDDTKKYVQFLKSLGLIFVKNYKAVDICVIDSYYGWPLGVQDLERFIASKYTDPTAVHHYEIPQTSGNTRINIKVMSTVPGATAVSNLEYEANLNEQKMQIKVLKPEYLNQFVREFTDLVREKE